MRTSVIGLACVMTMLGEYAFAQDLRSLAQSPYSIQKYVHTHRKTFDAAALWRTLKIPEMLSDPVWPGPSAFDCGQDAPCDAGIQPLQLNAGGPRFLAVQVSQPYRQLNRYLIFQPAANGWKLLGHIDSAFAKYFDPILFPQQLSDKWWLVLREQSGSGTGYYKWTQRWFQIRAGVLQEALSILDHAFILAYPGEFVIRPTAIVTDFQRNGSQERLRVLYRVEFTLVDENGVDCGFFGSIENTSVYHRSRNEVAFHRGAMRTLNDEISAAERQNQLAAWFLRRDFGSLLGIAEGPPSVEREWLSEHLKDFPASHERSELIGTLQRGAKHSRAK